MKLSTEDAGMPFAQLESYAERFGGRLEILLKIGGAGARNDIVEAARIGAGTIVAPMVESAYALEDFVEAAAERAPASVRLGVNVETAGAVARLDEILSSPAAARLSLVVVGRTDLSRSMRLRQDNPAVLAAAARVVAAARARGLATSIGGGVTPRNARRLVEEIGPDRVNTRLFVLDPARGDVGAAVAESVEIEVDLLADDAARGWCDPAAAQRRIVDLRRRLAEA